MKIPPIGILILFYLAACATASAANCVSIADAAKKIGENACVTGKVVKVSSSARSGTMFLNFCDDYKKCPFTVVVFSRDLPDVGDVRALEGQVIQIHGQVKEYHGQAEIILSDVRQLNGGVAKLPPLPKNYDVENKGKYSAGEFGSPKKPLPGSKNKSKDKTDTSADPPPGPPDQ